MTNTSHQPSRRDVLKWFAGIPFYHLGQWQQQQRLQVVTI